jgi:hypothetical protein
MTSDVMRARKVMRVDDTERAAAEARRLAAMQTMALVVLLERAGGKVTFSQAEYQAIVDGHGGTSMMAIHAEALAPVLDADPDHVAVSLITKAPGQGELVS